MRCLSGRTIASVLTLSGAILAFAAPASAAEIVLQNDGFVDQASVGFQQGFAAGEEGAVTLGPISEACVIKNIQLKQRSTLNCRFTFSSATLPIPD